MILEFLAAGVMFRRAVIADGFVRAASTSDGADKKALYRAQCRMLRGATASIVTGLIPPVVACTALPMAWGLPLASISLLVVTCDWLLSFCGARVRPGRSTAGMVSFKRIRAHERGAWQGAFVPFMSFLISAAFVWLALHPPSF